MIIQKGNCAGLLVITGMVLFLVVSCQKENKIPIQDNSNYVYKTVTIGTQVWMAENLRATHYRNGDPIPKDDITPTQYSRTAGTYCIYGNIDSNQDDFGYLYNGYSIKDSRNIAPRGWHIPTDEEWVTLINYLGGVTVAGGKLKEAGNNHWLSPNTGATNLTGFNGLSGGWRDEFRRYLENGKAGVYWSSSQVSDYPLYLSITLNNTDEKVLRDINDFEHFCSVRCIKDNGVSGR